MTKKTNRWLIALAVVALMVPIAYVLLPVLAFVWAIPDPNSVELNKPVATQLVRDFIAYGKIFHLDDCTRSQKRLNKSSIRLTLNETETDSLVQGTTYYKTVLQQEGIPEARFEGFRSRLESTELREYIRQGPYSLFVVDGYMSHEWGYLYTSNKMKLHEPVQVEYHTVWAVESLGDNWYRIAGH